MGQARTEKLSRLLAAFEAARRRERALLAQTLHDRVGGPLSAVGVRLELMRLDGETQAQGMQQTLDEAFDVVRELATRLAPDVADRVGMGEALRRLSADAQRRFAGKIACDTGEEDAGSTDLFRIAEEALDNAVRHSGASTVEIRLAANRLTVRDDGCGFDRKTASGLGLRLIRYLAWREIRRLRLKTSPGKGTIIEVSAPYAP